MYLYTVLQPFGRALVEAGKAFFGMEQEKGALRRIVEIQAGKCFDMFDQFCFTSCASVLIFLLLCALSLFCSRKGGP